MTGPLRPAPKQVRRPVREGYWFRPRRFGLGAAPATWQGWLLTLTVVAIMIALAHVAEQRGQIWLSLLVPLLAGFVILTWRKTDGEWRWRWGRSD